MADNDITKVEKIKAKNLTDIMIFLSYLKDKSFADKAQDDLDEQMRKQRHGR